MADVPNGGLNCIGNLSVLGNSDVNGDSNVDGAIVAGTSVRLTPTAATPSVAAEGMLYADTDHKLYFYNGTDWKEVAFV